MLRVNSAFALLAKLGERMKKDSLTAFITAALVLLAFVLIASPSIASRRHAFPVKMPCHLERSPACDTNASLDFELANESGTRVKEWIVYMSEPPELERQQLESVDFGIPGTGLKGKKTSELSASHRPVLLLRAKAAAKYTKMLPLRARYRLRLYETKLVAGAGLQDKPLSETQKKNYLAESFSLDYKNKFFQNWLKKNALIKGANETVLDFAYRAFLFLKVNYRYFWSPLLDRRASIVCSENRSDCAGLSYLYCAILRANKIACRPLIGRLAESSERTENDSSYFACHVRSEFYLEGVGWVPQDVSAAVSNRRNSVLEYFGKDDGRFIVMHENPDLILDSFYHGKKNIRSMPDYRAWADVEFKHLKRHLNWQVENTEPKGARKQAQAFFWGMFCSIRLDDLVDTRV